MDMRVFAGDPKAIGLAYGKALAEKIRRNLEILIWRQGYEPLPRQEPAFQAWQCGQEELIRRHWPWMLEEMAGVAEAVDAAYEDILLLNLRAWQYDYYGAEPKTGACTSLAVTLSDGTVACGGALDDPVEYYCGPVKFVPDQGHSFISFPITGTSWGNRGLNDAGLAVGISSQLLPGLQRREESINQDLAIRAMLQTCATAADARELCQRHPFTMNTICVDASSEVLHVQNTAAGLLELPYDGFAALTNHVVRDEDIAWLYRRGVSELPETPGTRIRRGAALAFCREHCGKCTAEDVRLFLATYHAEDKGSVHNAGSIIVTFSHPQAAPGTFWVLEGHGAVKKQLAFEEFTI